MTMEADLYGVLATQCARVFPDVADYATPMPYAIYQGLGGPALYWLDNTPADKRRTFVQIESWDETRAGALALARAMEAALCGATVFTAICQGEPSWQYSEDDSRYGTRQEFQIISTR